MKNKNYNPFINDSIISGIMDKYYKEIFNYCHIRLNYNKEDAEECVQETFEILSRKWRKLSNTDNIRAWLYRTSDYVMKNYNRKSNRHKSEIPILDLTENRNDLGHEDDNGAFEILSSLAIEEQQLLIEYYLEKATAKELAKKYKVSESAIFMRIHRIKAKLKKILSEENNM